MLPNKLLSTIEYWFSICSTCVRWGDSFSNYIKLQCGTRQGGVLSPYLFAVYIDDIIKVIHNNNLGCMIGVVSVSIFLFADDILLLAPSVGALQNMLAMCESFLGHLDMALNAKKCVCLRIGPRYKDTCSAITTMCGDPLVWVGLIRVVT